MAELTPRQILAKERYEKNKAALSKDQDGNEIPVGFDIYEIYTNLLFRTYETFEQARLFISKFSGYELRLKKGQTMNEEQEDTTLPLDEVDSDQVITVINVDEIPKEDDGEVITEEVVAPSEDVI